MRTNVKRALKNPKCNFYTLIRIQQLKLMRIRIRNPERSATLITPTWCSCQECSSCVPYSMCSCTTPVWFAPVRVLFSLFPAVCEYNFHVLQMSKSCMLPVCSCQCVIPTFCSCEYNQYAAVCGFPRFAAGCEYNFLMLQLSEYNSCVLCSRPFITLPFCSCVWTQLPYVTAIGVQFLCYVAVCVLFPRFAAVITTSVCCRCQSTNLVCYAAICVFLPRFAAVSTTSVCFRCRSTNFVCDVAFLLLRFAAVSTSICGCVLVPRFAAVCEYNFRVLQMSKSCALCSCLCIISKFCSFECTSTRVCYAAFCVLLLLFAAVGVQLPLQMPENSSCVLCSCLCITPLFAAICKTSMCFSCQSTTRVYYAAVRYCSCDYNFCMFQLSEYNSWGVQELVVLLQVDPQNVVVDVVPHQGEHSPLHTQPQVSLELILLSYSNNY